MPMAVSDAWTRKCTDEALRALRDYKYEVADPRAWGIPDSHAERVVATATKELGKCDVLMVISTGPSCGQGGEVTLAHIMRMTIVVWNPGVGPTSAWLMGHCHYFARDLADVMYYLRLNAR